VGNLKITVLGNSGGFPAPGGATSGYLLEVDGHKVLIDCGSGVLANLFKLTGLAELDAIIITHLHSDHISDIQVLKYAIDLTRKYGQELSAIPVFAPLTPPELADGLQSEGNLIIGRLGENSEINLFGAHLEAIRMEHPVETYGLRITHNSKVLAFTADSIPCDSLRRLLDQADLAIMDAGSLEKFRKPVMMHMTAAECAMLANDCNVSRLLLTHLLPLLDQADILNEAKAIRPETELAELMRTYIL
jgi:ribonuclease BN (tRNA processing enzyme)